MRLRANGAIWMTGAAALVLLAACSGEKRAKRAATPAAPPAATPATPAAPARPSGADAIDASLTEAQLFDATAVESLADIAAKEAQIRDLATKAVGIARRIETTGASQRAGLAKAYDTAIADREAAHASLAASLETFRTTSAETAAVVEGAIALCTLGASPQPPVAPGGTPLAPPPAGSPAAYPPCATLATEQAKLETTVQALSKAFESAEAAYRADRRRLDEASATMALAR